MYLLYKEIIWVGGCVQEGERDHTLKADLRTANSALVIGI